MSHTGLRRHLGRLLPLAGGTLTGALVGAAGSLALPGIAIGEADCGWRLSGAGTLQLCCDGVVILSVASGVFSPNCPVRNTDGTKALPSQTYQNDTASGWYRSAANDFRHSVGDVDVLLVGKSGAAPQLGFFGHALASQPAAYTQTYSTADRTIAARTAAALTDNSAGTPGTTLAALPTLTDSPASADALRDDIMTNWAPLLRNWAASLADQHNKNRVDSLDTTDGVNSLIDDHRATGLCA